MSSDNTFAWAGEAVAIDKIEDTLRETWRTEAAQAPEASGSLASRTNVLNLIVYTTTREQMQQVAQAIEHLGVHHPSRAILLLTEPEGHDPPLEAFISHNVQKVGERRLIFEQITLVAHGEAAKHLPSVVDALLIAELPHFVWWLGQPPFSAADYGQMLELVDRLIIDSATFSTVGDSLRELAEMTIVPNNAAVSDFAWERLRRWRELVAQLFDPPEYARQLSTISAVTIAYEPNGGALSEGLLAIGWLCSRLRWQVLKYPVRAGAGVYCWELLDGERTITVTLQPDHQDDPLVGLRRMTISTAGQQAGTFEVYREDGANLAAQIAVPGAPNLSQMMRAVEQDENTLLLNALGQFGHDDTYDGALVFAAQLAERMEQS